MPQLNDQTKSQNSATKMPVQIPAEQPPGGYPPPSSSQVATMPRASNGLAVAALVLGIASIVFCWWGIATFAMVVLAIVFGSIGIRRANEGAPQKNLAVAGLCCGIAGFIAYLIVGILSLGLLLLI